MTKKIQPFWVTLLNSMTLTPSLLKMNKGFQLQGYILKELREKDQKYTLVMILNEMRSHTINQFIIILISLNTNLGQLYYFLFLCD